MANADDVDARADSPGQSAFNPFGTVGTVVQVTAVPPPALPEGDWSLALVALFAGLSFIGWMMRKMLD